MSRYAYAFAILKSLSGHVFQFREALKNKARDQAVAASKDILERLRNSTIRIYKLWGSETLIMVSEIA